MNEQEKHAVSQEERKEKIRSRYKGVDRSELEFIPAKQKEKLFEDVGTKRVCAYCRVSTDDANQTSSYELQKNHYEDMIKEHAGWNLVGIYADEGISGTSLLHRDEFNTSTEEINKKTRTPFYPKEWKDSFGLPVEEHRKALEINMLKGYAEFTTPK